LIKPLKSTVWHVQARLNVVLDAAFTHVEGIRGEAEP
jgi:hypothetical protein